MTQRLTFVAVAALSFLASRSFADEVAAPAAHTMLAPADLKWGEGPPSLPPGAKMAVVYGDPSKTGLFILRAKVPANYKIPAHSHPTDETVTVLTDDPTPKTAAATPPAPPSKADAPTKK